MASKQNLPLAEIDAALVSGAGSMLAGADGSATVFHEEDGWIFSEQPGKGITCVGRSSELPQPYVGRHHYPSAG